MEKLEATLKTVQTKVNELEFFKIDAEQKSLELETEKKCEEELKLKLE